uniref:Uncharacterized protein MANES_13G109700 n=1 Tax=Rhizophora mucronata TaxID=61149 RepID=A0A2P2KJW3_RHIMU
MLSQELQKRIRGRPTADWSDTGVPRPKETAESREVSLFVPHHTESESVPLKTSSSEVGPPIGVAKTSSGEDVGVVGEIETDKHPVQSTEIEIVDKVVVEEEPINEFKHQHSSSIASSRVLDEKFEDDADDWLKAESLEMVGGSKTALSINDEEDVSFSDLEEDDGDVATTNKKVVSSSDTSRKILEIGFS